MTCRLRIIAFCVNWSVGSWNTYYHNWLFHYLVLLHIRYFWRFLNHDFGWPQSLAWAGVSDSLKMNSERGRPNCCLMPISSSPKENHPKITANCSCSKDFWHLRRSRKNLANSKWTLQCARWVGPCCFCLVPGCCRIGFGCVDGCLVFLIS